MNARPGTAHGAEVAWLPIVVPAIIFALAGAFLLPQVGISFDEPLHREQGIRLLRYYASGGADLGFEQLINLRFYGGLFDLAGALLERALGTTPWHVGRHALTLGCGALGVALAAAIAARLGGRRAGWTAGVFLAATPGWFGHSLFNPKDVPFALGYLAGLYALVRLVQELPAPPLASWLRFGLGTGLAVAIRASGIALVAIAALVVALHLGRRRRTGVAHSELRASARQLLFGGLLSLGTALVFGALFTPYLHRRPLAHLVEILAMQQRFSGPNRVLFAGEEVRPALVAHLYLPTWLGITLPAATLVGLLLALLALARRSRAEPVSEAARAVALAALVPLAWIVVRGVPLYDGSRHVLFAIAPLTILAALGWVASCQPWFESRPRRTALAVALVLCLFEPLAWIARARSYAYTYFNPLAGGLARASHRFDSDYWNLSGRAAAGQLDRLTDRLPTGETLQVRSNIGWGLVAPFLRPGSRVRLVTTVTVEADVELLATRWRADREQLAAGDDVLVAERIVAGQLPFHVIVDRSGRVGAVRGADGSSPTYPQSSR